MPLSFPVRGLSPLLVLLVPATAFAQTERRRIDPQPVLAIGTVPSPRDALAKSEPAAAAAILRGVTWLLEQQQADGRWDSDAAPDGAGSAVNDVGVTGLALLAIAREGTTARTDPRHDALLRGCHWLVSQQQEQGLLGEKAAHTYIYGHAIATLGLCATAAATGTAEARTAAEAALGYLEAHRNPFMVWRYMPRDGDNDTSVTTWATLACLAGKELGLTVPAPTLQSVRLYLVAVTDADGRAGYSRAGEPSSRLQHQTQRFPPEQGEAMTAAALWCRQALGERAVDAPQLADGAALLLAKPPVWDPANGKVDLCYWFFASEALRRLGDPATSQTWRPQLVAALVQGQRQGGTAAGSWDPVDPWGSEGGRLYSTALGVLALQALYDVPALQPAAAK